MSFSLFRTPTRYLDFLFPSRVLHCSRIPLFQKAAIPYFMHSTTRTETRFRWTCSLLYMATVSWSIWYLAPLSLIIIFRKFSNPIGYQQATVYTPMPYWTFIRVIYARNINKQTVARQLRQLHLNGILFSWTHPCPSFIHQKKLNDCMVVVGFFWSNFVIGNRTKKCSVYNHREAGFRFVKCERDKKSQ